MWLQPHERNRGNDVKKMLKEIFVLPEKAWGRVLADTLLAGAGVAALVTLGGLIDHPTSGAAIVLGATVLLVYALMQHCAEPEGGEQHEDF